MAISIIVSTPYTSMDHAVRGNLTAAFKTSLDVAYKNAAKGEVAGSFLLGDGSTCEWKVVDDKKAEHGNRKMAKV